jgi:1-acyl-sn-glycerol-3-phosphate acyltransferase
MVALERRAVNRWRRFPRETPPLQHAVRIILAITIRALLRVYCRFKIVGAENLPAGDESFILVANHTSHLDSVCLLAVLPLGRLHRAFPVAAEDYFFRSLRRGWFAAVAMNALPFGRRLRVREGLSVCAELLRKPGNVLIIFPEGTRSRSGDLQPFKPGIGALLAEQQVRVAPCYLDGAFRAWPKGQRFPRPRQVRLIIGHAMACREETPAKIAVELQRAVQKLAEENAIR